ncbi:hypothetical protein AB205_0151890 [Aquarana catesbeiana]|uniref:Uncharacterized protein n=1 Tax=Aquarana catesbeiana TaxID=8400 RepID=A0A2G9SNP8_AQUCT|nr:hypothetical protein AB205_0151890 [Aquarana catesbeiana]
MVGVTSRTVIGFSSGQLQSSSWKRGPPPSRSAPNLFPITRAGDRSYSKVSEPNNVSQLLQCVGAQSRPPPSSAGLPIPDIVCPVIQALWCQVK